MRRSSFPCERVAADGPAVEWEEVDCPLCGGGRRSVLVEAPDPSPGGSGTRFTVVRCHDCGLCFTNPRPTPQSIGRFYSEHYPPHARKPDGRRMKAEARFLLPPSSFLLPEKGRLLDFGCGGGAFLERMHRAGWQVTGIDASATAVRRVRTRPGLRAFAGTLPHPRLRDARFDVVTMWSSLEHVHRPLEVLRAARRLLAPGGRLVVGVPSLDGLPFRWFGPAWFGLDLPRHLTHFTPDTLRRMLEAAGFRLDVMRLARHSDWLRSSARLACRRPGAPPWQRLLRAKLPASLATWYCYLTGQADCIHAAAVKF